MFLSLSILIWNFRFVTRSQVDPAWYVSWTIKLDNDDFLHEIIPHGKQYGVKTAAALYLATHE